MDKIVYETNIKVWGGGGREGVTVVTEPKSKYIMMHTLTSDEWSILEAILESLTRSPNPIPYIIREVKGYAEEVGE